MVHLRIGISDNGIHIHVYGTVLRSVQFFSIYNGLQDLVDISFEGIVV